MRGQPALVVLVFAGVADAQQGQQAQAAGEIDQGRVLGHILEGEHAVYHTAHNQQVGGGAVYAKQALIQGLQTQAAGDKLEQYHNQAQQGDAGA